MSKKVQLSDLLDEKNPPKSMSEFRSILHQVLEQEADDEIGMKITMLALAAAEIGYKYGLREG